MRLLGKTKKLKIEIRDKRENTDNKDKEKIQYLLYKNEYINGMRSLFRMVIEQEELANENRKRFIPDEKRNIISIIGRRGSGKTTAMDEFCRILKELDNKEQREWWLRHTLEKQEYERLEPYRFKFHVLPPIDACHLGDKEDLFMLILVSIFRELEKSLNCNSDGWVGERELADAADKLLKIFKMYTSIQKTTVEKESSLDLALDFLASSFDIQKEIAEFVDNTITLLQAKADYQYFVIAIDDLDLNISHGYEMLEQLQKYFFHYKIIILISLDYTQMEILCQKHFYRELEGPETKQFINRHAQTLANDYLTKILHYSQRIYTPDIRKLSHKIRLILSQESSDTLKEESISVKNFVMQKIAEVMRIFYDGYGLKRHFCEPETVRELVAYNEFLESLIPVDYDKLASEEGSESAQVILSKYDQNHERFNDDILLRLAHNTLSPMQRDFFEQLTRRDIERRAMYFVAARYDANGVIKIHESGQAEYSYGALLETIYNWGREHFEDKPLISCVMASFTSEMVREYLYFRHYPKNEDAKMYKKRLVQFLGQSFGNEWIGAALPDVTFSQRGTKEVGYLRRLSNKQISININLEALSERLTSYLISQEESLKAGHWQRSELVGILESWIQEEAVLDTLECLDLLCTKREDEAFRGIEFKFRLSESEIRSDGSQIISDLQDAPKAGLIKQSLFVEIEEEEVTWDVMGFVGKSLNYADEINRSEKNIKRLAEVLAKYCFSNHLIEMIKISKLQLQNMLNEILLKESKFAKYRGEYFSDEAAFPFYDLDLAYNVCKRVRREGKEITISEEDFLEGVQGVFLRVEECLTREKEFYKNMPDYNYLEIFASCPYVRALYAMPKENKKIVSSRLMNVLYSTAFLEVGAGNRPGEPETLEISSKGR